MDENALGGFLISKELTQPLLEKLKEKAALWKAARPSMNAGGKMYITVGKDYEYTSGTDTSTSISFEPQKAIGKGFCFDCDKPVAIEYDQWWIGDWNPPKVCQVCGGHDVEFMGRVAKRLWECIEALRERPELSSLAAFTLPQ